MELLGETLDERIHRLAVRDAERREQLRQDVEELHHKDRAGAVDAMAMPNKNGRLERCPPKNDGFEFFLFKLLGLKNVKDLGNYGRSGL